MHNMSTFLWINLLLASFVYGQTIKIDIYFNSTDVKKSKIGCYDLLTINDCVTINEIGKPSLPVKPIKVLLPADAISCVIKLDEEQSKTLDGSYYLWPVQQPATEPMSQITFTSPDPNVYNTTATFPATPCTVIRVSSFSGFKIADLLVCPLAYSPSVKKVKIFNHLQMTLHYQIGPKKKRLHNIKQRQTFAKAVQSMVINSQDLEIYQPQVEDK